MLESVKNTSAAEIAPQQIVMRERQAALKELYATDLVTAIVTDHARSVSINVPPAQPLYGTVELGEASPQLLDIALHEGVGGHSDLPVPGDLFCGAIAGCLDSVIRVIANHLGIELKDLEVLVEADVDLRGTLMVSPSVPVGFQKIRVDVRLTTAEELAESMFKTILATAERCCVVLQSLRNPPTIELTGESHSL